MKRKLIAVGIFCLWVASVFGDTTITELKPLHIKTELVSAGKACAVIVAPSGDEFAELARRVQTAIAERTGVNLEIVSDAQVASRELKLLGNYAEQWNLIALGNVNSNNLFASLLGKRYVFADALYPGRGGYVLRTVHDPYAFGRNVLVLAGSDLAGVRKAWEVFEMKCLSAAKRGEFVIERMIVDADVQYAEHPAIQKGEKRQPMNRNLGYVMQRLAGFFNEDGEVKSREGGDSSSLFSGLGMLGETYYFTGMKELPPLMKQIFDKNRALLEKPHKPTGMSAGTAGFVKVWDFIEELDVWTDKDRLEITNAMLVNARFGHERRSFHHQVKEGIRQIFDENHGTSSVLHSYDAWEYFDRYYDLPESKYWMDCASAMFLGHCGTFQMPEDASGYLGYCPAHASRYALAEPETHISYFTRGILREHAKFISLCCINNLSINTGFGDSTGIVNYSVFPAVARAAWFYRDGRFRWILENAFHPASGHRAHLLSEKIVIRDDVEPVEPEEWTGITRFPIYLKPLQPFDKGFKEPIFAPKEEIDEKYFNKIVFKEGWGNDEQYLLLDGAGKWGNKNAPAGSLARMTSGHKQDDVNTIINFTDNGRMWLVDHEYGLRNIKDHSGLYISRNGAVSYRVHEAELQNLVQRGEYGLVRSLYTPFSGADWERSIFWKKGDWFLVIDRAKALEDGDFMARCSFRAMGDEELRGHDLYLSQEGKFCKIISDGGANVDMEKFNFQSQSHWESYVYAEPVVKVFQQNKKQTLKAGESLSFMNLLYSYAEQDEGERVRMAPAGEFSAVVWMDDEPVFVGLDSGMFVVARDSVFLAGERRLELAGKTLIEADAPVDMYLDMKEESLWVKTKEPMTLTLSDSIQLDAGEHLLKLGKWTELDESRELAIKEIELALERARNLKAQTVEAPAKRQVEGVTVQQTIKLEKLTHTLVSASLNGETAWIVGSDDGVYAFRPDGGEIWQFRTGGKVRAVDVGDVDGDGESEIAVGSDDEFVYLLASDGELKWKFQCKSSGKGRSLPPAVDFVKISDLDGDGQGEVVVGANWLHALDNQGELLWEKYLAKSRGIIWGDFACGAVDDLDGDGKKEVIGLYHRSYPQLIALDAEGNQIISGCNINTPQCVTTLDWFGEGKERLIACGTSGRIQLFWHDQKPREDGGGNRAGSHIALASFQKDKNSRSILFGATDMCEIMAYRAAERKEDRWIAINVAWHRNLGEKATVLLAEDVDGDGEGELLVGTKAGNLYILNAEDGVQRAVYKTFGAPIVGLLIEALDTGKGSEILVIKRDGVVEKVARIER